MWSGSLCPHDPDGCWVHDQTGEHIAAAAQMAKVTITFTVGRGYGETLWSIIRGVLDLSQTRNYHMEWKADD